MQIRLAGSLMSRKITFRNGVRRQKAKGSNIDFLNLNFGWNLIWHRILCVFKGGSSDKLRAYL